MSAPLKVLLVEDHEFSREAMIMYLERDFEVLPAADGVEALELLRSHPDVQLMLTDWMMPRMDGLELCRQARALDRDRYLHIIVFTARTQKEDLLAALQAGADAFVHKPVMLDELQAQINVARRIIDLQDQAVRRMEDLTAARQVVEADLQAAGRIQRSLLPVAAPPSPRVRFAWAFESSSHLGGDMFDVVDLGQGNIGVYVMDVCGTGAHAALLAVSIGWVLGPNGLLCSKDEGGGTSATPPATVARELNRRFPVLARSDQYFTMLYGVLDTARLEFEFVRAGHPAPVLLSERSPAARGGAGPPLGILPDADLEIESETRHLASGEMVLLYTDGLLRALGHEDRPTMEDELQEILRPLRGAGVQAVVDALREQVRLHRPDGLEDDVAIVAFEVVEEAAAEAA